jgi:ribosomal protein L20A (L18A)
MEVEGYSCMGEEKSRKQTKEEALADAKRKAIEYTASHIRSETRLNNLELEIDVVEVYSRADVTILDLKEIGWYKDHNLGECFRVWVKADVVPDEKTMEKHSGNELFLENPSSPLTVKLWTDKYEYKKEEQVKIYLKGNKPFYTRILYKDAMGEMFQLLPNPYRRNNYFNGGVVYDIPSGNDKYLLLVTPPFGKERLIVYASTSQLGDIDLENADSVYLVNTRQQDIGVKTRGVQIKEKQGGEAQLAEFYEGEITIITEQ